MYCRIPNACARTLCSLADLVPREVADAWLKYLREELPTVAFKCSTQKQAANLGRRRLPPKANVAEALTGSECLGAEALLQLLKNYARSANLKTAITVGACARTCVLFSFACVRGRGVPERVSKHFDENGAAGNRVCGAGVQTCPSAKGALSERNGCLQGHRPGRCRRRDRQTSPSAKEASLREEAGCLQSHRPGSLPQA